MCMKEFIYSAYQQFNYCFPCLLHRPGGAFLVQEIKHQTTVAGKLYVIVLMSIFIKIGPHRSQIEHLEQ